MNSIVHRVQWYMQTGADPADAHLGFNPELNSNMLLTEDELNTVIHPSSDWVLTMEFDERALSVRDHEMYSKIDSAIFHDATCNVNSTAFVGLTITREERFSGEATLRDLFTRIASGRCYGWFSGIERTGKYVTMNIPNLPTFEMAWWA
jgi:hypothetical protein